MSRRAPGRPGAVAWYASTAIPRIPSRRRSRRAAALRDMRFHRPEPGRGLDGRLPQAEDEADPARIPNGGRILQRIAVDGEKIRVLALLDGADVLVDPERVRAARRGCDEGLAGRQPGLDH